ncbi:MAG: type III-B CRISPR module-associated Cmr3 family protein, partial [Caldimicrobium sp.]
MLKFSLIPFDVLYFGSGRPFNFNVQETSSVFPPLPNTLASSVCSKLYHEKKINVENVLKKFYGPFLEKDGKILFPKPLDILSEKKKHGGDISGVNLIEKFNLLNPTYTDCKDLKGLLWQNEKSKEFEVFEGFITL